MTHPLTPLFEAARAAWATHLDKERVCGEVSPGPSPHCSETITLRTSAANGHRGFCCHAHDAQAQEDQIL